MLSTIIIVGPSYQPKAKGQEVWGAVTFQRLSDRAEERGPREKTWERMQPVQVTSQERKSPEK